MARRVGRGNMLEGKHEVMRERRVSGSRWDESVAGPHLFWRSTGESDSAPSPAYTRRPYLLARGPFLHLQSQQQACISLPIVKSQVIGLTAAGKGSSVKEAFHTMALGPPR